MCIVWLRDQSSAAHCIERHLALDCLEEKGVSHGALMGKAAHHSQYVYEVVEATVIMEVGKETCWHGLPDRFRAGEDG